MFSGGWPRFYSLGVVWGVVTLTCWEFWFSSLDSTWSLRDNAITGFKILRFFRMLIHICIIVFFRIVGDGVKRGRVSNCSESDIGCWEAQTGFARSGTGWVLELSQQIRECIYVESRLTSEECIYIGYSPMLMATHDSELTALYMETTNIVNSWKVVKGSMRTWWKWTTRKLKLIHVVQRPQEKSSGCMLAIAG